jgi:hypothetical protein
MSFVKTIWGQNIMEINQKFCFYLILALLFLLPWQTRWIFAPATLNGEFWEYGTKSLYGTEILTWLIILFFLLGNLGRIKNFFSQKFFLNHYKLLILYSGLFSGLLITAYFGSSPMISYYFVYRLLLGLIVCHVIAPACQYQMGDLHKKISPYCKLLGALWAGGVVQGILAIVQFFTQQVFANKWLGMAEQAGSRLGTAVIELSTGRWLRSYGSFGWANSVGIYLAIVWVVGLILYLKINSVFQNYKIQKYAQALISGGQLLILSGLILSFSRGSWIAAGGGVIMLLSLYIIQSHPNTLISKEAWYKAEIRGIKLKDLLWQLFYSFGLIIFFLVTLWPLFTTRFTIDNRLEQRSVQERIGQGRQAFQIITSHPLQGVGPGAFTSYRHEQNPELPIWDVQPVHAIYALVVSEVGIVVGIVFLIVFIFLIKNIWKYNRFYLSVIVVVLISGLFDHWLWSLYGGMIVWWVVSDRSYDPNCQEYDWNADI